MDDPALDSDLRALAHPARRRIVQLCADAELSVGELVQRIDLRQSTASQHLKVLRDAGLLTMRQDGTRRLYRVDFERLAQIRAALDALWAPRLAELKRQAEAAHRKGS